MFLEKIGADERVCALFRAHAGAASTLGRVSFAARGEYRLLFETGESAAAVAGGLHLDDVVPAAGDWVAARPAGPGFALIEAVLPRRTQLSRRAAGTRFTEQVLAANVDIGAIVCGLDADFNLRRLERYLALVDGSGAEPLIVLNKADLHADVSGPVAAVERIAAGSRVLPLSAHRSVAPLAPIIWNRTLALLGSSGAGKSTIANALLGETRQATADVRASDSRGRHTTTSRMLLPLPEGGAIIDTPGLRELQLWATDDSLDAVFPEITDRAAACRFSDCTHTCEPGCAVRESLASGLIEPSRWRSYEKLQRELRHHAVETDRHARDAEKRRWKAIHKELKNHPKYRF